MKKNKDPRLTYAQKEIGRHQLETHKKHLEAQLLRLSLGLEEAGTNEQRLYGEIKKLIAQNEIARREFERLDNQRRTWRDEILLKIYHWSVRNRFL